jgi:hypothetical protein
MSEKPGGGERVIPHEFIEVMNRRWCVNCDLFQSKKPGYEWRSQTISCPRDTPRAVRIDNEKGPCQVTDKSPINAGRRG